MLELFLRLRPIDQWIVVLFILFAIYIVCAVTYVQKSIWGANTKEALESFTNNLQALTARIDREYYDGEWMKERHGKSRSDRC